MGIFKEISPADVRTARSNLNQLVDIIEEDISGSNTRKKYQVFVTGGIGLGPGVTSSLFQTVYDQDFSLQTSNPIVDMTVGLWYSGSTVQNAKTGEDSAGKLLFSSQSQTDSCRGHRLIIHHALGTAQLTTSEAPLPRDSPYIVEY